MINISLEQSGAQSNLSTFSHEDLIIAASMPLVFLLIGLVIDLLFVRLLTRKLKKRNDPRTSLLGDSIRKSTRFLIVPLFIVLGLQTAQAYLKPIGTVFDFIAGTLNIGLITSSVIFLARLAEILMTKLPFNNVAEHSHPVVTSILVNLVRAIIVALGVLIALNAVGVEITPMLTALGVGGLAVALALQGTLSNFFSGIQLIASKRLRSGDYIQVEGGHEGIIHDINWRSATIQKGNGNVVVIPNSKLADAIIVNTHLMGKEMNMVFELQVAYESHLPLVEELTLKVAREVAATTDGAVKDFEPLVRFYDFGESGVKYRLIMRIHDYPQQHDLRHALVKKLHAEFQQAGIAIPYPTRTLHYVAEQTSVSNHKKSRTET